MMDVEKKVEGGAEEFKMEIKKLATIKKENASIFLLKDFGFIKANIIRRYIIDYVPTMAITKVKFFQNSSALYDEIIAHRLGLIPLKTDLKSYVLPEECESEDAAQCSLKMTLKAKGPKTVYAEEIKSKDPKVIPVYGKMPIVKLLEGQEIELEATAQLGRGLKHSKWTPAHIWYKGYPTPITNKDSDIDSIVKKYGKVFTKSGNKLKVDNPLAVTEAVEEFCENHGVRIEHSEKDIIFIVESFGQLNAHEILKEAINQYNIQLNTLATL